MSDKKRNKNSPTYEPDFLRSHKVLAAVLKGTTAKDKTTESLRVTVEYAEKFANLKIRNAGRKGGNNKRGHKQIRTEFFDRVYNYVREKGFPVNLESVCLAFKAQERWCDKLIHKRGEDLPVKFDFEDDKIILEIEGDSDHPVEMNRKQISNHISKWNKKNS